jgi:hypothetical protein
MSTDLDISLTAEQRKRLALLSERTGMPPGKLLDQLLQHASLPVPAANGQEKLRTLYDAFAEDGSIGLIKDGPTDKSTNPKYMKGFGRIDV